MLYFFRNKRLGLIRARLAGARIAKADTLVFLDAHCECVVQWLEPLMERIKEKPTSVLVPIIDVIEAKNFFYSTNGFDTFQVSMTPRACEKVKLRQNHRRVGNTWKRKPDSVTETG